MENSKCLELSGFKVYSQNDEDGIIEEIFNRVGTTNKKFVEFGVQNGLESNCHYLLHKGWSGLWLEGNKDYVNEINIRFLPVIQSGKLKCINAFITRDNINFLLAEGGMVGEIDLLSVDIDGNDYYVWEAINVIRPRVVVIEYNAKFPPNYDWKMAYCEKHTWDGSDWFGASLKAFELLGRKLGYQLVGTNLRGVNAFFVREEIAGDFFITPATAENLYNPARYFTQQYVSGHPAKFCLINQLPNIGVLNYNPAEYQKLKIESEKNKLSDAQKNTDAEFGDYDIIIPVAKSHVEQLKVNLEFINKNLGHGKIILICSEETFAEFKDYNVEFLDEDKLLQGMTLESVKQILAERNANPARAGWYLQQFLKMYYAVTCEKEHYLIWDADTIPLRPIYFLNQRGENFFNMKREHHVPYFETMQKLFDNRLQFINPKSTATPSFISEGMIVKAAVMRELIGEIGGENFWKNILYAVNPKDLSGSGFSEFETYGTYLLNKYPQFLKPRPLRTQRNGMAIFKRVLSTDELNLLPYDTISFENWQR